MQKKLFPSEQQDRFIVRLPDGMRDKIRSVAERNGRSMNAEIVARLQRSLDADEVLGGGDALDTVAYQAMSATILNKSIDHSALSDAMRDNLTQLSRIGENIIARMQFNKGNSDYITSVIPSAKPDPE